MGIHTRQRLRNKTPLIRTDSTLNVYHGMLAHFSPRQVADFFRKNPVPDEHRQQSLSKTLQRIHTPNLKFSAAYGYGIMKEVERFCCRQGVSLSEFAETCICRVRRGNLLPLRLSVRFFVPLLDTITGEGDLRHSFLRVGYHTVRLTSRHALFLVKEVEQQQGWYTEDVCYTPDCTFSHALPTFNVDQFLGTKIRANPRIFGYPDYERIQTQASLRALREIAELHDIGCSELTGVCERMQFSDFARRRGLVVPDLGGSPDPIVSVARQAVICPKCSTPLLRDGAAYGAPVHLFRMRYRVIRKPRNISAVSVTLTHATRGHIELESVGEAHWDVMRLAEKDGIHGAYRYDRDVDKLFRDGCSVTRGLQARMLRTMLNSHVANGQLKFSRQFLLADKSIGFDPLNPNFEVRMKRLMRIVDKKCDELRIKKIKQGLYELDVKGSIEMCDTVPVASS